MVTFDPVFTKKWCNLWPNSLINNWVIKNDVIFIKTQHFVILILLNTNNQYLIFCQTQKEQTEKKNLTLKFKVTSAGLLVNISHLYLTPWILGWGYSRQLCSFPSSPPWLWCRQRDSCILGIWVSSGTSSRCCDKVVHPLSYTPHSWGLPPQNGHVGTLAGHPANLKSEKEQLCCECRGHF